MEKPRVKNEENSIPYPQEVLTGIPIMSWYMAAHYYNTNHVNGKFHSKSFSGDDTDSTSLNIQICLNENLELNPKFINQNGGLKSANY